MQERTLEEPFASARYLAEKLEQPTVIVLKSLREELRLCKIKFREVLDELSEKQGR
jgi:hypothetical protein